MSKKSADSTCVPLCRWPHHAEYDGQKPIPGEKNRNHAAFERHYCVDMKREAEIHYKAFLLVGEDEALLEEVFLGTDDALRDTRASIWTPIGNPVAELDDG